MSLNNNDPYDPRVGPPRNSIHGEAERPFIPPGTNLSSGRNEGERPFIPPDLNGRHNELTTDRPFSSSRGNERDFHSQSSHQRKSPFGRSVEMLPNTSNTSFSRNQREMRDNDEDRNLGVHPLMMGGREF